MKLFCPATLAKKVGDRVRVEAYTLLFNAATRLAGAPQPLPAAAEFHHEATPDRMWNESYYFNFFDPQKKLGGFTRIGKLPNQESAVGILFLYQGDRTIYMLSQNDNLAKNTDEIVSGVMRYEVIEPLNRIRLVSSGQMIRIANPRVLLDSEAFMKKLTDKDFVNVDLDLTFSGLGPVHNFKNIYARGLASRMVEKGFTLFDLKKVSRVASDHYEQVGSYHGTVKIGGRKVVFQGTGHRDHSWGVRDWTAPEMWRWLTVQFGPDLALNLSQVKIGRVDVFNGYLSRQGRNYPYRRCHIETEFEADGLTQKNIRFQVEDITGFKMEVEGKVINPVPLSLTQENHKTLVNEAMTEYTWQGRTARGIAEYLHQIY